MNTRHPGAHRFDCRLVWTGAVKGPTLDYETYSREYRIDGSGKPTSISGTAATAFRGDDARWNPEEMLVASLSACHFLSYLALCARAGIAVTGYEDEASGTMASVDRVVRFTEVVLRPRVAVAGGTDAERARALHERAHSTCFIANSVNFPVRHEPTIHVDAPV
jgi:organic hydroperoxide reductase OsmC/OhrA